ncbi:MAG: hypothetical protein N2691_01890 [Patescibacteria group bacterium]|nr:hypothetical protein [Patescibacteria group bacterium]
MKTIHVVTGQTATGKTQFALNQAARTGGALINFDARQIYRGLDIVTGKDTKGAHFSVWNKVNGVTAGFYLMEKGIPLWLYDIIEPGVPFSAFEYEQVALPVLDHLLKLHDTVYLVGGSYFYLYNLLYQQTLTTAPPDMKLRELLRSRTLEELQQLAYTLNEDDFLNLNNSDKMNPRRLIRFIERARLGERHTGSLSFEPVIHRKLGRKPEELKLVYTAFRFADTGSLKRRIERRIESRLDEGALSEVQSLIQSGADFNSPGFNSIGYRQIATYLSGTATREWLIREWGTKERQFAKRQMTFMRRDPHLIWFTIP